MTARSTVLLREGQNRSPLSCRPHAHNLPPCPVARRVKRAGPLLQKTAVSHFMSESMFKSVFQIRKQTRLVEELRRLKPSESLAKFFCRLLRDSLEQCKG